MRSKKPVVDNNEQHTSFVVHSTIGDDVDSNAELPEFGVQNAQLSITPSEVNLENVILGSQAEAVLVLRAENGPLVFFNKYLAETPKNGFTLSGECMEKTQLDMGQECLLKVSWAPIIVQTIQNTLTIVWREDNPRVLKDERTQVQLKASSTDSKECVCCEIEKDKAEKVPRKVMTLDGRELVMNDDGTVTIDGKTYEVTGEVVIDPETGDVLAIVEPERVALSLKNEYLGRVTDTRTVVDQKGTTLGRLLGDDTLVDSDFKILGAGIPLVSVIDAQGVAIGKLVADDSGVRAVDAEGVTIGMPRVDKSVVDKAGVQIGTLRDWGMTLDLSGDLLGAILPTGAVMDKDKEIVGYLQQNGFVTNKSGALVGGVVPKGMAVGTGCKTYGSVALNGQVKDAYGQVIGRVMLDGGVVDTNFNELGSVVNQGLVVDMKGNVVGFVNSEGKAVDGRGMLIGCVAPDGTVSANKKMVGGVLQKGKVVGNSCDVLGSVYPDAQLMSADVREIGRIRSDGYAINPANKVIGAVVPHGTVLAEGCRLMGTISITGQVLNEKNMSIGCINMQKQALSPEGKEIGKITPTGPVLGSDGSLIGRVRYDGRIIDKAGKIIDCASPEGAGVTINKGVVLDENGLPSGLTVLAGRCFNERNEEAGIVAFNGWVSDKNGHMIGFMPPDGVIVSDTGVLLGSYNRLMGAVLDTKGENLGRVMPDGTVIDIQGTKILGALVAQNTIFAGLDGNPLGKLNFEGQVVDENNKSIGRVVASGALYNAENALIGGALATGPVLAANGSQVGWANANGDVLTKGTRIANMLPNGLAVTPDNRVVGRVWMPLSVVVSSRGVVGTVVPKAVGTDASLYQAAAYDKMGNYLGTMSPFGVLLGSDGRLGGIAQPITMVMDLQNHFIGWVGFRGQVINANEKVIGQLIQNGLVANAEGNVIGMLMKKGSVVNAKGNFMGLVGSDGGVYNGAGSTGLFVGPSEYIFNKDLSVSARIIPEGLALSSTGKMLGWTALDGQVMNAERKIGLVALDDRISGAEGQLVASYVPLGAPSVQENEKMCGVVNETGVVVSAGGRVLGTVLAPDYVVQNNTIVGRVRNNSLYVRNITDSDLTGVADLDGTVYRLNATRQVGTLMMNGLVADSAKKVMAGVNPTGFANSTNLKPLGTQDYMGSVWLGGKIIGTSSGTGLVSQKNSILGGMFAPEVIVDRNGLEIGRSNAQAGVVDKTGKKIASRMAFYSALTPETIWAGGPIKTGAVIDDYARKIGTVAGDGLIINAGILKGRILPDASAAGVSDRAVYNPMPYVGHLTTQGLPMGYNETVLGRTTVQGDLIDASDKIIYQTLDDGTILGKERPLEGAILTFRPAVSYHDEILGIIDGDGKISVNGEDLGRAAANGAIVANMSIDGTAMSKLKEAGGLIPESLIVNDSCAVVGQTSYTGEVINGQGNTVGRVQPTLYAVDPQGKELGRSVRYGPITSLDSRGIFVGRTMPDSTVVNPDGVNIGCARLDKLLVDADGNELGRLRNRGPVFDFEKKMVGRVDAMGRVVGTEGEVIGVIGGRDKDIFYDLNGNERGWMADKEDRLVFNPDGTLELAIGRDGWVKDGTGEVLFKYDQKNDKMYDKWGNLIGEGGESYVFLYDMQDKVVARLIGCELQKVPGGEKMGTLLANGDIRDDSNELILTTTANAKVYNPDGTQFGRFAGIGLDLRRCGLSASNLGNAGRTISWGKKKYQVDSAGMITDDKGRVVGGWDSVNNRPYIWDVENAAEELREPPPLPKTPKIPQDVIDSYVDLQQKRRAQMKEKIGSQGSLVLPGYNVQELSQVGKSDDWSSVGTEKKNISTWPVDMSRVLLADKAIPAVLVHSIDTRYPEAPVTAIVERHIYGEAGRNILIPAGSRLIGKLGGTAMSFGLDQAAKVSIAWERLIRPDGAAFRFEATSGDAQGRGGVAAYLDLQLWKKYGLILMGSVGESMVLKLTEWNEKNNVTVAAAGTSGSDGGGAGGGNAGSQIRSMFIENFKEIWDDMMQMAGQIPNVLFIPSGTRLTAYSKEDLWLRSEDDLPEPQSDSSRRYENGGTFLARTGSWTNERSKEKDIRDGKDKKGKDSDDINGTPGEEAEIYAPADINDRIVEPVSRPIEEKNYF